MFVNQDGLIRYAASAVFYAAAKWLAENPKISTMDSVDTTNYNTGCRAISEAIHKIFGVGKVSSLVWKCWNELFFYDNLPVQKDLCIYGGYWWPDDEEHHDVRVLSLLFAAEFVLDYGNEG